MKTIQIIIITICFFVTANIQAQTFDQPTFEKGQIDINVGFGFLPADISIKREIYITPATFTFDFGLSKKMSGGLFLSTFIIDTEAETKLGIVQSSHTSVGVRLLGHVTKYKKWDIYGGAMLATTFTNKGSEDMDMKEVMNYSSPKRIIGSPILGWKYRMADPFSCFAEIGYTGNTFLTVGAAIRI